MRKGRFWITVIFLACVVFVSGALSLIILRLRIFTLEQIQVRGNERVSEREILKRSGLIAGKSTVFFFENGVIEEVLKNRWIGGVHIKREFPRKVVIEVKEVKPFCLLIGENGETHYVSEEGKKLGVANFSKGLDFPVLIGEGIWESEILGEALDILKLSLKSNVLGWKEISEINLDSIYGITVFTNDGRRVDFGNGNVGKKWYKVEKMITHARGINLTEKYINISSERVGIVNFKL